MTPLHRAGLGAALTLALVAPAAGAHAGDLHWKTLASVSNGDIQACKIATKSGDAWKIRLRVDASHADGRVNGTAWVTKNGKKTGQSWKSGWVDKGHVSTVGTVLLPMSGKDDDYELNAGIGAGQMGNGGTFKAKKISLCS